MNRKLLPCIYFVLVSCIVDNDKTVNLSEPKYKTTDASELFFKNVRAIYYDREEMLEAKLDVYRLKQFTIPDSHAFIKLAIVMNWIKDEAYVLVEAGSGSKPVKQLKIKWVDQANNLSGVKSFDLKNKDQFFIFTGAIYDHILNNHQVVVVEKDKEIALFPDNKEREAFRTTMYDFYNLVEIL